MAPLYYRANLLTIPTSIGYTPVYGILGNKMWMNEWYKWSLVVFCQIC